MGDKFSWDRLLKRNKEAEADNTIDLVQKDQPSGPVAPLRSSQAPPVQKMHAVPDGPPPVQSAQQSINRAPLVIEWDEFQQTEEAPQLNPISVPTTPVNESTPGGAESTDDFWARLNQDTKAALENPHTPVEPRPTQVAGWDDVDLTPQETSVAPVPAKESDMMAGTIDPDSYQPIASTYQRPTEEEIRKKTEAIAQSSAWDETPVQQAPPVTEQQLPQTFQIPQVQPVAEAPSAPVEPPVVEPTSVFSNPEPPIFAQPPVAPVSEPPVTVEAPAEQVFESAAPAESTTLPQFATPPVVEVEAPVYGPIQAEEPPATQEFSAPPVFDVLREEPEPESPSTESEFEEIAPAFNTIEDPDSHIEPVADQYEPIVPPAQFESVNEPVAEEPPQPLFNEVPEQPVQLEATPDVQVKAQATPEDFWASIPGASVPKPVEPEPPVAETIAPPVSQVQEIPAEYTKVEESEAPQQVEKDIRIGDVLLKHKLVAPAQLERALARQADSNEKLGQVLISMGLISERRLLQVLASQKGVSPWHLEDDAPSQDALGLVSHDTCQLFQVLPVAVRGDLLLLAMRDTSDQEAIETIRSASGKRIEPVLADEVRLAYTIDQAYGVVRERHHSAVEEMVAIAHEQEINLSDGTVVNPERPDHLTALLRELIVDARRKDATSITIGQLSDAGEILYRIHGRLCPVQKVPLTLAKSILNHAQADLEQQRLPFAIENGYKVALTTGQNGDQFVVTFPQSEKEVVPLDDLGIEQENLKLLREITERPYGLFLITGSARSAKQVTLASLAQEMELQGRVVARASEGENIAEQIGLAVTSESEVIVVGELDRDEDVKAAVKAASSGHLILAEVTANDAPTAIQQLISCGADPYLLATILTGVWCQAVAPKLCLGCRQGQELTDIQREILDQYGMRHIQKVFESNGCESCNHTSVSGQIVLSEVLPVSSDVSHMIAEKAPVEKIAEQAGFAGYLPMDYDAMTRIIHGDVDFATAKKLVFFKQRELAAISRRDTWETQAS